jgi:hypothetical protein
MKPGKFLEMVVDCLQRLLAPDGFSVTRNEKYYQNGQLIGEIDVLVQGLLGSEHVKIAIECRDRKGLQGRPWIREIIGKRTDLRRFGITHWMAVSAYGFTSTAEKLAKEFGLILIVPGKVTPIEPQKFGLHKLMQWSLVVNEWNDATIIVNLDHESDEILDYVEQLMKDQQYADIFVKVSNDTQVSMVDFINIEINNYLDKNSSPKMNSIQNHSVLINNLRGIAQGVDFNINRLEISFASKSRKITPNFRIIGFVVPQKKQLQVLAIIGINEYTSNEKMKYLMVGFRSGDIDNAIMVLRDIEGNLVPNTKIAITRPKYPPGTPLRTLKITAK